MKYPGHKAILEVSGIVGTVATVFTWLGVSPSITATASPPLATPVATVVGAPAAASPTAAPALTVKVPAVTGLKEDQAKRTLEAKGLRLGRVTTQAVEGVPEGVIASQQPRANVDVPRGGTVDVVVSKGAGKGKRDD